MIYAVDSLVFNSFLKSGGGAAADKSSKNTGPSISRNPA